MKNSQNSSAELAIKGFALVPVIIILAVFIGGGLYISNRSDSGTMMESDKGTGETQDEMMQEKADMMNPSAGSGQGKDGAMEKSADAMFTGKVLAGTKAPLLDFVKADYDVAVKSGKLVVLYFYADWCPLCKAEFPKMQAAFNALTTDGVVGFRVNFKDSFTDADEEALARQFGVPYQHTKVFVKNGTQVLKSPESWDEARHTLEINKALTNN